jgi:hypothetical protein
MKKTFIVVALCLVFGSCLPPGRKLLSMKVSSAGEKVLETNYDVSDTSDESEMWEAAGQCPFSVVYVWDSLLMPDQLEDGPLLVGLEGEVSILITWTGELQAHALLEGATIETCSAGCAGWHLTSETVMRAKEASGL